MHKEDEARKVQCDEDNHLVEGLKLQGDSTEIQAECIGGICVLLDHWVSDKCVLS